MANNVKPDVMQTGQPYRLEYQSYAPARAEAHQWFTIENVIAHTFDGRWMHAIDVEGHVTTISADLTMRINQPVPPVDEGEFHVLCRRY